jgi:hypothetical protein
MGKNAKDVFLLGQDMNTEAFMYLTGGVIHIQQYYYWRTGTATQANALGDIESMIRTKPGAYYLLDDAPESEASSLDILRPLSAKYSRELRREADFKDSLSPTGIHVYELVPASMDAAAR